MLPRCRHNCFGTRPRVSLQLNRNVFVDIAMQGKRRAEITGSPPWTSDSSLPSAALPASGSRGLRQNTGLSATRLPRIYMSQNRTGPAQVNCAHNGHESHEGTRRSNDVVALDELGLLSGSRAKAGVGKIARPARTTARLSPLSHWCGKWPAIRPFP